MATTDLLLLEPIDGLGNEGEQVTVKAGFARNFLLPKKKAVPVTRANRKQIEALQKRREERLAKERDYAEQMAAKLETARLAIAVKTGPGGKVFGSVTAQQLQERLAQEGIELDRRQFTLYTPAKALGKHTTKIKLHPEIDFDFEFEIVSENPIEEEPEEEAEKESRDSGKGRRRSRSDAADSE